MIVPTYPRFTIRRNNKNAWPVMTVSHYAKNSPLLDGYTQIHEVKFYTHHNLSYF